MTQSRDAVLLLSGGMDSIAIAYRLRPRLGLTIDYGQIPAQAEIDAASAVCAQLDLEHRVVRANCSEMGSGQLAGSRALSIAPVPEWWPFRNQLLATIGGAIALSISASTLMLGTVKTDRQHADGSPEFVNALSHLLALQEGALRLEAPGIDMTSTELIRWSNVPFEVLAWAHSCHTSNLACGRCRGCAKHFQTMRELGYAAY